MESKKIQASLFKAKCLEILENVPAEGLIITKHGEPVAKILPIKQSGSFMDLYGSMVKQVKVHGDYFSTGESWDAES